MELMQLEMFVAMVEEGSFHKAADRVFRTRRGRLDVCSAPCAR